MSDVIAQVHRGHPSSNAEPGHGLATFGVPYREGLTLLNLLRYIYQELDHTLAFRDYRCGYGICGSCRVRLNGKVVRACITLIRPGDHLCIEPLSGEASIKDLAVEMEH